MDEFTCLYGKGNALEAVYIRRKLGSLKFNESEDIVAHLSNFENLSNQLKSYNKPLSEDDEIAYLIASFPESYDSVVSYFEALPQDQRTITVLKSRYKSKHQNRINRSEVEEHESSNTSATSFMSNRNVQGRGRSNFRNFSRRPTQIFDHSEDRSSNNRHRSNYQNRSNRGQYLANRRGADRSSEFTCFVCIRCGLLAKNCTASNRKTVFAVNLLSSNVLEVPENSIKFIFDCGATDHIVSSKYKSYLRNLEHFEHPLNVQTSKRGINLVSYCYGDLDLYFNGMLCTFENVL